MFNGQHSTNGTNAGYTGSPISLSPGSSPQSLEPSLASTINANGRGLQSPRSAPATPPLIPPRNPARGILQTRDDASVGVGTAAASQFSGQNLVPPSSSQRKPARLRRPSTATGATGVGSSNTIQREEVTPWEFQTLGPQSPTKDRKVQIRDLQMTRIMGLTHNGRTLGSNGGISPDQSPPSLNTAYSPSLSTVSLSSSTAMPPPGLSHPSTSISSLSKVYVEQATATGPIDEVTPWELYPVPNDNSSSISLNRASTDGRMGTTNSTRVLSSTNSTSSSMAQPTPKRSMTITGPIEEVTPWELSPGPTDLIPPGSPTKVSPDQQSKPESKSPKRPITIVSARSAARSTSYPRFMPHADGPVDLLEVHGSSLGGFTGSLGLPPSPAPSKRSFSQISDLSYPESKISKPAKTNKSGKDVKSGASGAERTRQLPLTGPLEEVAPWEMHPPPDAEIDDKEKRKQKSWFAGGRGRSASSLNLGLSTSPPISSSPSFDLLRSPKSAGHLQTAGNNSGISEIYTNEDRRSISSSALSVASTKQSGLGGRLRSNSVAASMEGGYMNGRKGESSISLPSCGERQGIPCKEYEDKVLGDPKSFPATAGVTGLIRGRSLNSAIANMRPGSYSGLSLSSQATGIGATSMVSSMNTAQMEVVIPWELLPLPPTSRRTLASNSNSGDERERKTSRASTSSTASRALADLGLKRRRSTTAKAAGVLGRMPSTSGSGPGSPPIPPLPSTKGKESSGAAKGISNVNMSFAPTDPQPFTLGQTLAPIPVASTPSSSSTQSRGVRGPTCQDKSASSLSQAPTQSSDSNLAKFSTADRTILEELKANIRAREAQFVIKGVGHRILGGRKSNGKKYHPYPKDEVPYPRSYDREVVDLDVWETMFSLDLCKGLTWHIFETPPTKVLEIGCGTGTWILHAARTWKNCHFVGLDIVPLHPNLQNVASPDLSSRITWVQHNFLDGLPFQNEEFDYVYIKRIALGVPEDRWDTFFEEVQRIMKPGGAFEMIEEDLFFPGKLLDDNDDVSTLNVDQVSTLTHETLPNTSHHTKMTSEGKASSNPKLTAGEIPPVPQIVTQDAGKLSPSQESNRDNDLGNPGTIDAKSTPFFLSMPNSLAPHNPRDHTILEAIWQGMLESRFVNSSPLSVLQTYLEYHFKDVRTHPPLLYSFPPVPTNGSLAPHADIPENNVTSNSQIPTSQSPRSLACPLVPTRSFDANDHPDEETPLASKSAMKHRSLYIALDETRSDALSPADILHLPKKTKDTKPHIATLPNRTLTIDLRTLNLHLALRAREVVACSESMWEWVQECQNRQSANKCRYRSGSIEVALLGSTTALNGYNQDDLLKNALLEMTRDDFDQMLNNFQLDMQDRACVGHVLEERFNWHSHQSEPLQDRKAFDEGCRKYEEWLADIKNQLSPQSHRPKALQPSCSSVPSTREGPDSLSQASQENLPSNVLLQPVAQDDLSLGRASSVANGIPTKLLPRQSRAMRVFVAWKASNP